MLRLTSGGTRGVRWAAGFVVIATILAAGADPADARGRRKHAARSGGGYSPPYSAIVVDANSGAVLHASDPDSPRHPASLTKIMTLYLLFERLEAGKVKLDSQLRVSAHAASRAPSKLGLKPGSSIAVEDAIRAVVTKSANDVASVIAEGLGGDEEEFAKLMTRKARALGMSRTTYVNASGLPDPAQVTTARDQALLGRAIQERFPKYYRYFATPSFSYRGQSMRNHNHLLGSVKGLDGIKTGYTNASGFNLVTSVRRDQRHIVAVVLGGSSAASRDARMRSLIETYVVAASTRHTAPMIAEARDNAEPAARRPIVLASAGEDAVAQPSSRRTAEKPGTVAKSAAINAAEAAAMRGQKPAPGSSDPIKPILVKTIKVKLGGTQTASLAQPLLAMPVVPVAEEPRRTTAPARAAPPPVAPAIMAAPVQTSHAAVEATAAIPAAPATAPAEAAAQVAMLTPRPAAAPAPTKVAHSGWIIQIGAFDAENEARQRLNAAQSRAKRVLARAEAFTEPVVKGDKTLYRARFAGFEKESAEAACRYLKRNEIACMTIKN